MGEVREGIYPQVSSRLQSKFAPWNVNPPGLLGGVTYPGKDQKPCLLVWVFPLGAGVERKSRGFLAPSHLWGIMVYISSCAKPYFALRDQKPWRRSLATEQQGPWGCAGGQPTWTVGRCGSSWGKTRSQNTNSKECMYPYAHCSVIISSSQAMEATQVPINRQMDKRAIIYL